MELFLTVVMNAVAVFVMIGLIIWQVTMALAGIIPLAAAAVAFIDWLAGVPHPGEVTAHVPQPEPEPIPFVPHRKAA